MGFCNSEGEAHFVVMIRGLFWDDTHARIYAGCGVVEQSVFEKEWEEVKLKMKSIEKNFGLVAN
jgi:anthranilate synthase component 1